MYSERFYREGMGAGRFLPLLVKEGESDLWIGLPPGSDPKRVEEAARSRLGLLRSGIEAYAASHPAFYSSLEPLPPDPEAEGSGAVRGALAAMLRASRAAGVGPMAAVAGAVAQELGEYLASEFSLPEIAIENGGDDYLKLEAPILVSIYAGLSSHSNKLGLAVPAELSPLGICTSSATVGPSLSFGNADACLVACADCALADAYATAFGNRARRAADIQGLLEEAASIPAIVSMVLVRGDTAGAVGALELRPL